MKETEQLKKLMEALTPAGYKSYENEVGDWTDEDETKYQADLKKNYGEPDEPELDEARGKRGWDRSGEEQRKSYSIEFDNETVTISAPGGTAMRLPIDEWDRLMSEYHSAQRAR